MTVTTGLAGRYGARTKTGRCPLHGGYEPAPSDSTTTPWTLVPPLADSRIPASAGNSDRKVSTHTWNTNQSMPPRSTSAPDQEEHQKPFHATFNGLPRKEHELYE